MKSNRRCQIQLSWQLGMNRWLDEMSEPTYDELYGDFKEFHDNWIKISKKNACLRKWQSSQMKMNL